MAALVDVVVPVLGRPQRAKPFMRSLRRTVPPDAARVLAVHSPWDPATGRAWSKAGADIAPCHLTPGSFAQKGNEGYMRCGLHEPAPWLLFVGDDVEFHPGWLDAALTVAEATGADVVGTNDLGERHDAENAVHPLIRRAYITEQGACWDGPGVVFHEGYRHHFTDAELSHVSREREVWAAAPLAVVEHLHWRWEKAPLDDTYKLGARDIATDRALFYDRCDAHAAIPPPRPT